MRGFAKLTLVFVLLLLVSRLSALPQQCETILSSGTYTLTANVTAANTCFEIQANDVTINCGGYNISYAGGGNGVHADGYSNITIGNCNIIDTGGGATAMYLLNGANVSVVNNTISKPDSDGIHLTNIANSTVTNNTVTAGGTALYIETGSSNVTFASNTFTSTLFDANLGVVALSVNSVGNTFINNTITSMPSGYVALWLQGSSNDNTFTNNTINALGGGAAEAVRTSSSSNNYYNNTINSSSKGITFWASTNSNFTGNNITSNFSHGANFESNSNGNNFTGNRIQIWGSASSYAVYLRDGSQNNFFSFNTITSNNTGSYAVNIATGTGNTFASNTITSISDTAVYTSSSGSVFYDNFINGTLPVNSSAGGANSWNTTLNPAATSIVGGYVGGNFYAAPSSPGFSQNLTACGSYNHGICSNNYTIDGNNVDFLPLFDPHPMVNLTAPWYTAAVNGTTIQYNYTVASSDITSCQLWSNQSSIWALLALNATPIVVGPNTIGYLLSVGSLPAVVVWNVNCTNPYASTFSPVNASFNATAVTGNLAVWDQTTSASLYDSGQIKQANNNVTLYANYSSPLTGLPIPSGATTGCNVTTYAHTNASMTFNVSNGFYWFIENFTTAGPGSYNVTCFNDGANLSYNGSAATIQPQTTFLLDSTPNSTTFKFWVNTPQGQNNITVTTSTDRPTYYGYSGTVFVNVTRSDTLHTNMSGANYSEYISVTGLGTQIHINHYIHTGFNCTEDWNNPANWFQLQSDGAVNVMPNFNWADGETKCIQSNYTVSPTFNANTKFTVVNSMNFSPVIYGDNNVGMHAFSIACGTNDCSANYNSSPTATGPMLMQTGCNPGGCAAPVGQRDYFSATLSAMVLADSVYNFNRPGACHDLYNSNPGWFNATNKIIPASSPGNYLFCFTPGDSGGNSIFTAITVLAHIESSGGMGSLVNGSATINIHTDAPMQYITPDLDPYFDTNLHNVTVQINGSMGGPVGMGEANVTVVDMTGAPVGTNVTNASGQVLFPNLVSGVYTFVAYGTNGTNPALYNETLANQLINGTQVNYNYTITNFDNVTPTIDWDPTSNVTGNYSDVPSPFLTINFTANDTHLQNILINVNGTVVRTCASSPCNYTLGVDGVYSVFGLANDTVGHTNQTAVRNYTRDTTDPWVVIFNPLNGSYYNGTVKYLNYSVIESTLNITWYTLNGAANVTITSNTTLPAVAQGWNNITVWANDSFGNTNFTGPVFFYFDNETPGIGYNAVTNASGNYSSNQLVKFDLADAAGIAGTNATIYVNGTLATTCVGLLGCNVTLSSPGVYSVFAVAVDLGSNTDTSATRNYTIDFTQPSVAIAAPLNNTWYNSTSVTLTYHAFDANLNRSWFVLDAGANNYTGNGTQAGLTQGTHTLQVFANDSAGSQNQTSVVTFYVDSIAPVVVFTNPANGSWHNAAAVAINFTVVDANYSYSNYSVNGSAAVLAVNGTLVPLAADGQHWITVTSYDLAGNFNTSQIVVWRDMGAPQLDFKAGTNASGYYNSAQLVNFTVTDANLSQVLVYMNGTVAQTCTGNTTTYCNVTLATAGAYNVSAYAIDGLGITNTTANRTYIIDFTPPALALTSPANNSFHASTTVTLTYQVSDPYLSTVWRSLDGGANLTLTANGTFSSLSQGAHNLTLWANDSAGNLNTTGTIFFTVDTAKPQIIVTSPTNGAAYNTSVTLNYTIIDSNFNASWFVLNGVANYTQGNVTLLVTQGTNTVVVRANDSAGNPSQSALITFTVDSQPPQYAQISTNSTAHNQSTRLSAYWTDALTLGYAWLSTNNTGTWLNSTPVALSGSTGYSNFTLTLNSTNATQVQWIIYANDTAGNLNFTPAQNILTTNTLPQMLVNPTLNTYTPDNQQNLTCITSGYYDADGDAYNNTYYIWYRNGAFVGIGGLDQNLTLANQLPVPALGDTFYCETHFEDIVGDVGTSLYTPNATVSNVVDLTPPQYLAATLASTSTGHNTSTTVSVNWTDNVALNGFIFGTNNTGTWVNTSFTPFTSPVSSATFTLNATNATQVSWKFYANDTNNNWNETTVQNILTTNNRPTLGLTTLNTYMPAAAGSLTCINGTYSDANGDPAQTYVYFWYRNGTLVAGQNAPILALPAISAGANDNITCSVIVSDGLDNSISYNSSNATVDADPDLQKPRYVEASIGASPTLHSHATTVSVLWTDNIALGSFNFSTNNSGSWVTQTGLSFTGGTGTQSYSNYSFALNNTSGATIAWYINASDIGINSNVNDTGVRTFTTTNTPPTLGSTALSVYSPTTADAVTCIPGSYTDNEGDSHGAFAYQWYKNGTALSGATGATLNLPAYSANAGDNVSCSVRTSDGYDNSAWYSSINASVIQGPDLTPPTYTAISASNTNHNMPTTVSVLWNDNSGLDGYIFSTNNTGTWLNNSLAPFLGSAYSNHTFTLTATNGASVGWRIYATDIHNNWNDTGIQTIVTTNTAPVTSIPTISPVVAYRLDTLTCASGTYTDANGDSLMLSYLQWYRNGALVAGGTSATISLEVIGAAAGDNLTCSQKVYDGFDNSTWYNSTNRTILSQGVPPLVYTVASGSVTSSTAIITWFTDTLSNSAVYYGTDPANLSSVTTDAANVTSHSVTLTSLSASTTYSYLASSCDRYGNCANSSISEFSTTAAPTPVPTTTPSGGTTGQGQVIITTTTTTTTPPAGPTGPTGPTAPTTPATPTLPTQPVTSVTTSFGSSTSLGDSMTATDSLGAPILRAVGQVSVQTTATGELTVTLPVILGEGQSLGSLTDPTSGITFVDNKLTIPLTDSAGTRVADIVATTSGVTGEGTSATGQVTSLTLTTREVNAGGNTGISLSANLNSLPASATLSVRPAEVSADATGGFATAAGQSGFQLGESGPAVIVEKTGLENGVQIRDATITMSVDEAWVQANGGVDSVRVFRQDGDTREMLQTQFVGYDAQGRMVFRAISPNGLSLFALYAVKSIQGPTSVPTVVPTATPLPTEMPPTRAAGFDWTLLVLVAILIAAVGAVVMWQQKTRRR